MKLELNPGHIFNLKELGIMEENEGGIEPGELVARALSNGKVEEVLYVLEQDFANRQTTFLNLDLLIEDTQNFIKVGKEKKEEIEEAVNTFGFSLYYATVQIDVITVTADEMKQGTQGSDALSHLWTKKAEKHWAKIHEVRDKTKEFLKKNGEIFRKNLDEFTSFLESLES